MKDVQNEKDIRGIDIQKVGVSDVHLPFYIKTKEGDYQQVLANIKLTVELPKEFKGTHMSRFIEVLTDWSQKPISSVEIEYILRDILSRLNAERAFMELAFKYFIKKTAPVSGLESMLDCDCWFSGSLGQHEEYQFVLGMAVPYTSLCPCSKEISQYGAHNQRGVIKVKVRYNNDSFLWLEDIADIIGQQGSCQVYPLLKREDEKYVTEKAYENPKFVEDILRDGVLALRNIPGIIWFDIECINYESIHNHSAYAQHNEFVNK